MRTRETHIGDCLGGRFLVTAKAGEGGMSIVWDARDLKLGVRRAVKEVKPQADEAAYRLSLASLRREALLMRGMVHPLLPRIHDIVEEEGRLFVVMEYIEGLDLLQVMRQNGGTVAEADAVNWGIQLCEALQYLHTSVTDEDTGRAQCIVYRDMKPSNVKLTGDGTVRIFDFGISRVYSHEKAGDTTTLGTRGYASPETFLPGNQTDPRSDIYSLGATLFHLVTGRAPAQCACLPELPPVRSLNPALSEGLEKVIACATRWTPELRYAGCNEMRWDLEHLDELTAAARKGKRRTMRRWRALVAAAACSCAVGACCIATGLHLRDSTVEGLLDRAAVADAVPAEGAASAAEELCARAIEADRGAMEPYLMLVTEVYPADGEFDVGEAGRWSALFDEGRDAIAADARFAALCYKVGQLYFNCYVYGDDVTRGALAAKWFDAAIESYEANGGRCAGFGSDQYGLAKVYSVIGGFSQALMDAMGEGTENRAYAEYWNAFEKGVRDVHDSGASALAQMRMYELAFDALNSEEHLAGFRNVGIAREAADALLDKVCAYTAELGENVPQAATDAADQITADYTAAKAKIAAVYSKGSAN